MVKRKPLAESLDERMKKVYFEAYENFPSMPDSLFRDYEPPRWHERLRWWIRAKTLDRYRDWLHRDCD